MKLVHTVPAALVESIGASRAMHIAYAEEILTNATYREFYAEKLQDGAFVILNTVERGAAVLDDLVEAAVKLRPSEVILPNIPNAPEKSARLTAEASGRLQSAGVTRTSFMAVPHGEDFHAYCAEVNRLANFSQVRVIGVTADVFGTYHLTRKQFIVAMRKVCPRTLHLLGLNDDLADAKDPLVNSTFRSCDTPKASVWGLSGIAVNIAAKRVPVYLGRAKFGGPSGFIAYSTDDTDKIDLADKNISEWD